MKQIVNTTMLSAYSRFILCNFIEKISIFAGKKEYQFEIFGYDFMIDSQAKVWLIEINTNPCLEESSPLLHKLIPRMLSIITIHIITL